jgi:hypothetical protein
MPLLYTPKSRVRKPQVITDLKGSFDTPHRAMRSIDANNVVEQLQTQAVADDAPLIGRRRRRPLIRPLRQLGSSTCE